MVTKKEGATMNCQNCGSELICRKKEYSGGFAPTLQWQNDNGQAHYHTEDGQNFTCNIPDDKENDSSAFVPNPPSPPVKTPDPGIIEIKNQLDKIEHTVHRIFEMTEAVFHYTVDTQLKKNETND